MGIVATILFVRPCKASADEYEQWFAAGAAFPLAERVDARLVTEIKYRTGEPGSYLENIEAAAVMRPAPWLELGPSYLYERMEDGRGAATFENRYSFEITAKAAVEPARFALRQMASHRDVSGAASWRYRVRMRAALPPWGAPRLSPFVSEELFYESARGIFNQSRLMAGVDAAPWKWLEVRLYWLALHRRGADDGWRPANVAGLGMGARF